MSKKSNSYPSSFILHPSASWQTKSKIETKRMIFKICTNCKKDIYFLSECYYAPSVSDEEMLYVCSVLCGEIVSATRKIKG
jgi:hypothetical protein